MSTLLGLISINEGQTAISDIPSDRIKSYMEVEATVSPDAVQPGFKDMPKVCRKLKSQLDHLSEEERADKIKHLKKRFCLFKSAGVLVLILVVLVAGTTVFIGIEGTNAHLQNYKYIEEQVWFNESYRHRYNESYDDFFRNASRVFELQCEIALLNLNSWNNASYVEKLAYAISIVSSVGWGVFYPKSEKARVISVIYALIGIPIYLSLIGQLVRIIQKMEEYLLRNPRTMKYIRNKDTLQLLLVLSLYGAIVIEGLIFVWLHTTVLHNPKFSKKLRAAAANPDSTDWTVITGIYFQFTTVSTIGFGDVYIYQDSQTIFQGLVKNTLLTAMITSVIALYTRLFDNFSKLILSNVEKRVIGFYLKE